MIFLWTQYLTEVFLLLAVSFHIASAVGVLRKLPSVCLLASLKSESLFRALCIALWDFKTERLNIVYFQ